MRNYYMTVDNQRHILQLGHFYLDDAVKAIKKNNTLLPADEVDMIEVVTNNDLKKFRYLDTAVRDQLLDILAQEFCFMDYELLMKLSNLTIRAIQANNRAVEMIYDKSAIESLRRENKELQEINSLLCDYAKRTGIE